MDIELNRSVPLQAMPYSVSNTPVVGEQSAAQQVNENETVAGVSQKDFQLLQKNPKVESQEDDTKGNETQELDRAVTQVTEFLKVQNRQLSFSVDDASQRMVIEVMDKESGEVIRQIPSEEMLELAERIENLRSDAGEAIGVLVNREV